MNDTNVGGTRAEMLTALLHDAPKAEDHDGVREFVRGLIGLGCAPLLISPGTKVPIDLRTPAATKAADKAAQLAAREAGERGWRRRKSKAGAYLATTDADALLKSKTGYLDRYIKLLARNYPDAPVPVNIALSPGSSRLVVVDCDTAEQVAAFLADMGVLATTAPTVRTPGAIGPDGEWIHSEGGHWWFVVPEGVELPDSVGALTDPAGGYTVMWGAGRYALVPPSVRAEGAYVAAGGVWTLPPQLVERITSDAEGRAARARSVYEQARAGGDAITAWGAVTPWGSILVDADGWLNTGKADSCGCDIWTAPGVHDSPKSATAHEPGCAVWVDSPDPPLHIWTTGECDPFTDYVRDTGKTAITRLQAVAAIDYDNDLGAAMDALDLHDDGDGFTLGEVGSDGSNGGSVGAQPVSGDQSPSVQSGATASDGATDAAAKAKVAAAAVAEAKAKVAAAIAATDRLFDHSPILEHLAACADARGSSRVAVLVQVLARTALAVPPCVVIPARLGGDHVGLSVLVGVVGESSGGKGRAEAVGRDAVVLMARGRERNFPPMQPSTGEGLTSMFAETEKEPVTGAIVTHVHTPAVLLSFKDIETFGALASRSGNSLSGALLSLYMGDTLGAFTRESARRVILPAHTVVAALSAGVQPAKGSVLLSDAMRDSGMPQRFIWTPVRNGRSTARGDVPTPLTVEVPDLGGADLFATDTLFAPDHQVDVRELVQIDIAQSVSDEINAADAAKDLDVFGAVPEGHAQLAGHAMLTQVKVAFLLAALHGDGGVSAQWWELAGLLMAVSEATAAAVEVASQAAEILAERQAGVKLGHRFAASDEVREDGNLRQVADQLLARVGDSWGTVNGKSFVTRRKQDRIPEAWQWLIDRGQVESRDHEYKPGQTTCQYRRARG